MDNMSADEKFVRDNWKSAHEEAQACVKEAPTQWHGYVIVDDGSTEQMIASGNHDERWAAAAEFACERLEQIRQVEEEIKRCEEACAMYYEIVLDQINEVDMVDFVDCEWDALYDLCANARILGREQAALAELKKGMKEASK